MIEKSTNRNISSSELLDALQIACNDIESPKNAHHNRRGLLKGVAFSDGYLTGKRAGLLEAIEIIKKCI